MRRALRWIGWGFAGLVAIVVLAVVVASNLDNVPKKFSTTWIDGPGDSRIRGETWVTSSLWDEWVVHEYTEVAADGTETPIGEGPQSLDIARARLYANEDQAELVVMGHIFRRDRTGGWSTFRADDAPFVYRHYVSNRYPLVGNSWYYASSGITCWIDQLDPVAHRLVSTCNFPASVRLVFRRDSYEAPWVLDESATFAETPPPERARFPDSARGKLTVLRTRSVEDRLRSDEVSHRLEDALAETSNRVVAEVEFELVGEAATEVVVEVDGYKERWRVSGGWVDSEGWPVVFWSDYPIGTDEGLAERRGQPWGEAWLVERSWLHREKNHLLTFLELRAQ